MAILAALIAFGSRFATKILTTTLGWASTLLFGRVPASRQILLLGRTDPEDAGEPARFAKPGDCPPE